MNRNPVFHAAAASVTYAESPMIHIGNIRAVFPRFRPKTAKKREEREAPPSGQSISRFPACQFTLSEDIGALGVVPLFMGDSIAAMPARYVNARRIERQVYQPGLNPLSRVNLL